MYIGSQAYLNVTEPEDLEFFMTSTTNLKKSDLYNYIQPLVGQGLATSSGKIRFLLHIV